MDFSEPFRTLAPTLDGAVLRVLARVDGALTTQQVIDLCNSGSPAGIRKVLRRLSEQGVVTEERIGRNYTFCANREHLVWEAVELILSAPQRLDEKIKTYIDRWEVAPISVELFGSVASGEATPESDVDVLIVRPAIEPEQEQQWNSNVTALSEAVERWTGNPCETLERTLPELVEMKATSEPVLSSPRLPIAGHAIDQMLPTQKFARTIADQFPEPAGLELVTERIGKAIASSTGMTEFQKRLARQLAPTIPAFKMTPTHGTKR